MSIESLKAILVQINIDLGKKEIELNRLESELIDFPEDYDLHAEYDRELDEAYEDACNSLPVCVSGSELIEKFDPTLYRCGYSDFVSDFDFENIAEYTDLQEDIEDLEATIEGLKERISEIEEEIEEEESEE